MTGLATFLQQKITVKYMSIVIAVLALVFLLVRNLQHTRNFAKQAAYPCDSTGVGITDLVRKVKKELANLEDSMVKNNESAMFRLRDMQLEISFVVRYNNSVTMGGSYELVSVEGEESGGNEHVQKLILHWVTDTAKTSSSNVVSPTPLDQHFIDSIKKLKR